MKLKIRKMHPAAIVPKQATAGAACFDLHAIQEEGRKSNLRRYRSCSPLDNGHSAQTFRTGLAFEVPPGWAMLIFSRSGHGFNTDARLANCVGVIDSDYRGEVQVRLTVDGNKPLLVDHGDRIAQAMLVQVPQIEFELVDWLSETARGAGGFGSTGVAAASQGRDSDMDGMSNFPPRTLAKRREMSDREWAARDPSLREGSTVRVPGVGEL